MNELPNRDVAARVLIWRTGPISELGWKAVCGQLGVIVVPAPAGPSLLETISTQRPHAVVVDIDTPGSGSLSRLVAARAPHVVMIAYSASDDEIGVYPPAGRPYRTSLTLEHLAAVLTT